MIDFIPWYGRGPPPVLPVNSFVELKHRSGSTQATFFPYTVRWAHNGTLSDIIGYRVLKVYKEVSSNE